MSTKSNLFLKRYIRGFTLAEVLITLLIVGVVASLIIPSLINDTQKAEYVTALKKQASVLTQAYMLIKSENGGDISTIYASGNSRSIMNAFAEKLNATKICYGNSGCFNPGVTYKYLDGDPWYIPDEGSDSRAILSDGTLISILNMSANCSLDESNPTGTVSSPLYNTCGIIRFDVNGNKGPNSWGKDLFDFIVTKKGIYPRGTYNDGWGSWCPGNGSGCTSQALREGAENY